MYRFLAHTKSKSLVQVVVIQLLGLPEKEPQCPETSLLMNLKFSKIIPGQKGKSNSNHGGGGGGGSFVVNAIDSSLLIAAGGGGGAGGYLETTINPHLQDEKDAVSETSGTDAQTQGPGSGFTSLGQGGSSGSGGTGGVSNHPGGGGAGFLTDGMLGQNTAGYHAFAGVSFSNGFIGGDGRGKPDGGFGGGGSATWGGGGGGYSGGGGGVWTHPGGADWGHGGGGGGSFNSESTKTNWRGKHWSWKDHYYIPFGNEKCSPGYLSRNWSSFQSNL